MRQFLIVNPGSGADSPTADELRDAAAARGVEVRFLEDGDDLQELARSAGADVLGMAGGDGSLAAVAEVAIEQDMPFVCIPFGTRNHFARDLGLDRDDPIAAWPHSATASSGGSTWRAPATASSSTTSRSGSTPASCTGASTTAAAGTPWRACGHWR